MPRPHRAVAGPARGGRTTAPRAATIAFVALAAAGVATHAAAAWLTWGGGYPDEHQHYAEQAYRLACGFGWTFWEQQYGVRGDLYPTALSLALRGLAAAGVDDPPARAAGLRLLVGMGGFAAVLAVAWDRLRERRTVWALSFLGMAALLPFPVLTSVRLLSEVAVAGPVLLAAAVLPRRPVAAGVLFGLAFAVRLPTAFAFAGFVAAAAADDLRAWPGVRRSRAVRQTAGFAAGAFAFAGVPEWAAFGTPFHCHIEYFRHTILMGKHDAFGREPWWFFAAGIGRELLAVSPLAPLLAAVGAWREWRWAVPVAAAVAAHSAVGHKEYRFVWFLIPLGLGVLAGGVEGVLGWAAARGRGPLAAVALGLSAVPSPLVVLNRLEWNLPIFVGASAGLAEVGRRPDVVGVAVHAPAAYAGNYFYLNRAVPLVHTADRKWPNLDEPAVPGGGWAARVNYLVADPADVAAYEALRPEPVADLSGGWKVYRLP
jgi:phosphatidylinositol glycan class B